MSKIRALLNETVLYGLGSIVPRVLNFFLVSLHTRIFLPSEYGILTNLFVWVGLLNIVYTFGMETSYFRFATKPGADPQKIFRSSLTFVIAVSFILSATIIFFSAPIAELFSIGTHVDFIIILAITMFFDSTVAIPFAQLRLKKKASLFALMKVINVVVIIGLNFFFLLKIYDPHVGVGYILYANLIANFLYILFFLKTFLNFRPLWNKLLFSQMFKYAYPIALMGLPAMTNEMFSRMILAQWLPHNFYPGKSSLYALGVFGACFRFSVFMNLVVQAFRFAAEPFFFSNATNKNSPTLFAKVNHYFIIVCCFILISVSVHLDIIKHFISEVYREGIGIVPILLIGYFFLGVYYNFSIWFKLTDKTYFGTLITASGTVLTIFFNYLLIPYFGYFGSSWATVICYGFMMVVCYLLGQKYFPIPYKILYGFGYFALSLVLIQSSIWIKFEHPIISFSFHNLLIIIYLAIAYIFEHKQWGKF